MKTKWIIAWSRQVLGYSGKLFDRSFGLKIAHLPLKCSRWNMALLSSSSLMTTDKKLQAWERDITNRQRNIVFPDTVLNEGRFYRHIIRYKMKLNVVQRVGVVIVSGLWIAGGVYFLVQSILAVRDDGDWRTGLIALAGALPSLVFGLILAYNGLTAASAPRPPRWWRERKSRRP